MAAESETILPLAVTAYIGLGSNLGDGNTTLQDAWAAVGATDGITLKALSSPYVSAPVGMESANWFTNGVGELQTRLSAIELLDVLLRVERDFGRRRDPSLQGYQDRTLDLDLLYYGSEVIRQERLTLPHPLLAERLFVLEPLAEIAVEWVDPADGLTPPQKLDTLIKQMAGGQISQQEIRRAEWL